MISRNYVASDPSNDPLGFNQPQGGPSAHAVAASEADASRQLLQIVQADRANVEKTEPILFETGTIDGQILASISVPFRFNSVILCVNGGIVAMTHGDVSPSPALVGPLGQPVADPRSPLNWQFGAMGISPGTVSGANAQPIGLFTGPQEIRFKEREAGQKVTFWIHPDSYLALRASIDPVYAKVTMVGAVEYLK